MERLKKVKQMRLNSSAAPTRAKADKPHLFFFIAQPQGNYLIIPRVSSENRRYIPIGFMSNDIIASDSCSIVPYATLYHFGVLTSNVHMAWTRAVCCTNRCFIHHHCGFIIPRTNIINTI